MKLRYKGKLTRINLTVIHTTETGLQTPRFVSAVMKLLLKVIVKN